MTLLAELGLAGLPGVLLIAAPDSILAEAGGFSPRPSFVSSLRTAHPAPHIVWWPEREMLTPEALSRLHWLVQSAAGEAWLLTDLGDDDPLTAEDLGKAVAASTLVPDQQRLTSDGATAIRCTAPSV